MKNEGIFVRLPPQEARKLRIDKAKTGKSLGCILLEAIALWREKRREEGCPHCGNAEVVLTDCGSFCEFCGQTWEKEELERV